MPIARLDLSADVVDLAAALCDAESVSLHEGPLVDALEAALAALSCWSFTRRGNVLVARTDTGAPERVVLAGHVDTVPLADPPNLPTRREDRDGAEVLWGRGTVDMKGGVAVQLAVVQAVEEALSAGRSIPRDLTVVLYDAEEIASEHNGLGHLVASDPDLLAGDLAVLLEPTGGTIEGGCKGTLRVELTLTGTAAHSGRPWKGHNAIHDAADVLALLSQHLARVVEVDGLTYHEGLQAVGIRGGIAGNVIPDECVVTINYRFAPDRDGQEALAYVRGLFPDHELVVTDLAPGARPGLDRPAARALVDGLGVEVGPKEGWTDVARFTALGMPAVNFGPGDPGLAHHDDEHVPVDQLRSCASALVRWVLA